MDLGPTDLDSVIAFLDLSILWRVVLAMAIGGIVGLERELADKPAGLRTHMFVAGASCLLVLLGGVVVDDFQAGQGSDILRVDPIRLFEAIVVGVSFLGTGTIWQSEREHKVRGLTTAASLLFIAALGIAVAVERAPLAVLLALLALLVGRGLGWLERRIGRRRGGDSRR